MQQVRLLRQPVAAAAAAALGAAASAGAEPAAAAAAPAAEAAEGQLGRAEGQEALLDRPRLRPEHLPPVAAAAAAAARPAAAAPRAAAAGADALAAAVAAGPSAAGAGRGFVARDTSQGGVPVALVALGGGGLALAAAFLCLATGICCPNAAIEFNRRLRGLRQPAAAVTAEAKADPEPAAAPPPRVKPAKGRAKPPSKPKGKYGRIDAQSTLD